MNQELGKGAFGEVHKVQRMSDDKVLAMKLINYEELKMSQKEKANMIQEIGLL